MKIIIIGGGITGSELARRLIRKKHDVVLVEKDEEVARHATNRLDCMVIQDSGNDTQTLLDAGIKKANALIAVTDSDELNMIICGIAESLAPEVVKIARVRNEDYVKALNFSDDRTLGINALVYPDEEAARAVIQAIEHGAVSDILSFENSSYELTRFNVCEKSILDGLAILDIHKHIDVPFIVVSVEQNGRNKIPSGNTVLTANTRISILTKPEYIEKFYDLSGFKTQEFKKIALVGMGRIGESVAEYLIKNSTGKSFFSKLLPTGFNQKWKISIIENDEKRAKEVSAQFPQAVVYRADVTDESFIEEIKLDSFDLVICTTLNYELNMIVCAYLKTLGVYKTISLVQSSVLENVAYKIGIDVAVSFKDVVVDSIMGHLINENVTGMHTMGDGKLEIIELYISEKSRVLGKKLKDIAQHGIYLVLLITGKNGCIIPKGDTEINEGDKIVFIVKSAQSGEIIEMFGGR